MRKTSYLPQRYERGRQLGASGLAEVFVARQTGAAGAARDVVVKRFARRLTDEGRAEAFVDEALRAAGLAHPNIAALHDLGFDGAHHFAVRAHHRGMTLGRVIGALRAEGRMVPMEIAVNVVAQLLEALRYAHAFRGPSGRVQKVVHRALGPENVLLSLDGVALALDFGTAWPERFLRDSGHWVPRHFAYIAPECFDGGTEVQSDIFSLGVLLYELTVGQRVFEEPTDKALAQLDSRVPPPTFARAGYPADLEDIVMQALERDPADRFPSAEAMLEQLEQFADDTGLRISRLRLGRFVAELTGSAGEHDVAADDGELERSLFGSEELDFDRQSLLCAAAEERVEISVPEAAAEPAVAPAAAAEPEPEPEPEREHGPAAEAPPSMDPRGPEARIEVEPVRGVPEETVQLLTRRRERTVAVTDEQVEEELDLDGDHGDGLFERPASGAPEEPTNPRAAIDPPRTSWHVQAALDDLALATRQARAAEARAARAAAGAGEQPEADELDGLIEDAAAPEPEEADTAAMAVAPREPPGPAAAAIDEPLRMRVATDDGPAPTLELPGPDAALEALAAQDSASAVGNDLDEELPPGKISAPGAVDELEEADGVAGTRAPDDLEGADHEPEIAPTEVSEALKEIRAHFGAQAQQGAAEPAAAPGDDADAEEGVVELADEDLEEEEIKPPPVPPAASPVPIEEGELDAPTTEVLPAVDEPDGGGGPAADGKPGPLAD